MAVSYKWRIRERSLKRRARRLETWMARPRNGSMWRWRGVAYRAHCGAGSGEREIRPAAHAIPAALLHRRTARTSHVAPALTQVAAPARSIETDCRCGLAVPPPRSTRAP